MNKIGALLGRFLLLLLYCSTLFYLQYVGNYYTAMTAKEITTQFLEECYESGLTASSYESWRNIVSELGFTTHLYLESTENSYSEAQISTQLQTTTIELKDTDFLTSEIIRNQEIYRIGGKQ